MTIKIHKTVIGVVNKTSSLKLRQARIRAVTANYGMWSQTILASISSKPLALFLIRCTRYNVDMHLIVSIKTKA